MNGLRANRSTRTRSVVRAAPLCGMALFLAAAAGVSAQPSGNGVISSDLSPSQLAFLADRLPPDNLAPIGPHPCENGMADIYLCDRVDLLSFLPLADIGGGSGNDVWGWEDPVTGKEYAIMGRSNGTAFVDISDPTSPLYVGNLPSHTGSSSWRDIKVYQDHAFIVSDRNGSHGLQVFHLEELRNVVNPPQTFTETGHYAGFGSAHNIAVNESSGFGYVVGGDCSGGLHMVDLAVPDAPAFAGCFSADGYTHDAQCVSYGGPDPDHQGKEICFNSNEDTLTIVDVTEKSNPVQLSRSGYTGSSYTHQGWLTEDHRYFLLDDELDESSRGHNTKTYIWDVRDLDAPVVIGEHVGTVPSIDHNQYVHQGFLYQANYRSGLRILSLDDVVNGNLTELAYFDIYPANDTPSFNGAWSVFPYFDSGVVAVSGIEQGLFVLNPILCTEPAAPTGLTATAAGDHTIDLEWGGHGVPGETYSVYRSFGTCPGSSLERIASGILGTAFSDTTASGQVEYSYVVRAADETGFCQSEASNCASATTTGTCNAPPIFAGLQSVTNSANAVCALDLSWDPATPLCGALATYSVYRDTVSGFTPSVANRIVSGLTGLAHLDMGINGGQTHYYVARSTDTGNGVEDGNLVELSGLATGPLTDGVWSAGGEIGDPAMVFSTEAPEHLGWGITTARQHSGDRSYYSGYEDNLCVAMVTPPLQLTAGESSFLSFWTAYDIESSWDGGVVQISDDGGVNWATVPLTPGYPGTFNSGPDACGFNAGDPSFTGFDLTWNEYTGNLSVFNGSEVQIRWILSTDSSVTAEGWFIDDVAISHVQVPGECLMIPLFADGFESGDTSAWSGRTP